MDIYWIKDKRKCGPATVPDILSKVQTDELTADTLGWHAGCASWLPLRELPALADFLNRREEPEDEGSATPHGADEEPAREEETPAEGAGTPADRPVPGLPPLPAAPGTPAALPPGYTLQMRVYLPGPVVRLLARLVDYALYATAFYAIMQLRGVPYDASLMLNANPLMWLPMLAIEAFMLSTWGTTPGKALMGIRMNTFGEVGKLGFFRAFMRSLMAFTLGMGIMMPIMMPVMLALSYMLLRRRGITQWDALCSTLPVQKAPALPSRYVLAVIALYICLVLAGSCLKPWIPGMLGDMEKQNPKLARTLRELMPEEKPAKAAPAPKAAEAAPATPAAPEAPAAPALFDPSLPGT